MNRRKHRKSYHRNQHGKSKVNLGPVIVIICLSICAGYFTAKYVVYPILGYEPTGLNVLKQTQAPEEETKETTNTDSTEIEESVSVESTQSGTKADKEKTVIEDKVDVKDVAGEGYALQFGSYSTRKSAEKTVKDLKSSGVKANVVKKDGNYKVIGKIFETKDKARTSLEEMDKNVGAFITTVGK
ncbi:MAG: SPOR domain-containing protein [Anaerovoracaceae bacterium]